MYDISADIMSEYAVAANGHANRLSRTDKHAPKSMYDLLESYDFSGKTVIPFATSGSSEIDNISDKIKTSCSEKADFKSGKRFSNYSVDMLKNWVDTLNI